MKDKEKAIRINQQRCVVAIIFCSLMVALVFIGVVRNIFMQPDAFVKEVGSKTFRMFTVQSNMLVASMAMLCIPFEIDGIRKNNYHLPRWIVICMYVGVNCVTLTILIALTVLSPIGGYKLMMLQRSNLFLHTLCPIMAILLLLVVNTDHNIKFKHSFIAIAPVFIYGVIYVFMVFVVGEENGGWRDHYHFAKIMPWYLMFIFMMLLTFGIANLLRVLHNRMHMKRRQEMIWSYQNSPRYDMPTIEGAIAALAREQREAELDNRGDINIPRRIIRMFEDKYHSGRNIEELCIVYIKEYLK